MRSDSGLSAAAWSPPRVRARLACADEMTRANTRPQAEEGGSSPLFSSTPELGLHPGGQGKAHGPFTHTWCGDESRVSARESWTLRDVP